nr:MAG TPA: hypothetical protein [Caudoviricetes sp.]
MSLPIELAEIAPRDELLGPLVDQTTLAEAHEALYVTAMNCHVDREDITATYWVKRYIESYCFWRTAILKSYSTGGSAYNSGEEKDSYAQKIAFYEKELKALESKVTAQMLTGSETNSGGFRAVHLYRG